MDHDTFNLTSGQIIKNNVELYKIQDEKGELPKEVWNLEDSAFELLGMLFDLQPIEYHQMIKRVAKVNWLVLGKDTINLNDLYYSKENAQLITNYIRLNIKVTSNENETLNKIDSIFEKYEYIDAFINLIASARKTIIDPKLIVDSMKIYLDFGILIKESIVKIEEAGQRCSEKYNEKKS